MENAEVVLLIVLDAILIILLNAFHVN